MGTFNYSNPRFRDECCIAVKCDICKAVLWTDLTGFFYGDHIRVAREHGWAHRKTKDGKWIDVCDECVRAYREKKRQEYFDTVDFKEERNERF